jgi:hypothetical protein
VTRAAALIAIVLVAGVAAVVLWPQPGAFRAWLVEVRDGDDEWGWELLDAEARAEYGNDRAVYIADVATADWASLDLGPATEVWSKDGFVRIEAELRSDPATVPVFLLERRIVHGVCEGRQPVGIGAYEDRRPFQSGGFGGGGLSGGGRMCNAAFTDAGRPSPEGP